MDGKYRLKCRYDLTVQFTGMGFTLLDGPVVSTVGTLLGFQETKPLSRSIVLVQAVSSLAVEPYDADHSLKKPYETGNAGIPGSW